MKTMHTTTSQASNATCFQLKLSALTIGITCAIAMSWTSPVHAQSNLGNQIFQGVYDAIKKQAPAGLPTGGNGLPDGMVPQPQRPAPEQSAAAYPTLAIFLDATRKGTFASMANATSQGQDVLARSMISVLRNDYGVAPLPNDTACFETFKGQAVSLLARVTTANVASLGRQPPNFVNTHADTDPDALASELDNLRHAGGWCDLKVLGQERPHPYKQALPKLLTEYGRATQQWVETERSRRKVAYQAQQEQLQLEADQRQREAHARDTERRADEQKRIDAERARIERDQKLREAKDKSRVGG
jgi:hypothetical protein